MKFFSLPSLLLGHAAGRGLTIGLLLSNAVYHPSTGTIIAATYGAWLIGILTRG
ncbi:hypothetical protein UXN85_20785 [Enterobacter hormaechei]